MSIQKAIERLMDKMWDQAEDDREFELHDELRTILNMYPEPTVELPASVEPQDSDCASCYTGTDCGMCTTIAPPGDTSTVGESLLTSREEAASKAGDIADAVADAIRAAIAALKAEL